MYRYVRWEIRAGDPGKHNIQATEAQWLLKKMIRENIAMKELFSEIMYISWNNV